jgi:hypothetical protein
MSSTPVFSVVRVARSLVFCVMFCRSLFVLLLFFYWSLHCLSFFGLRLLVTPLISCGHCIVCYCSNYASGYPFGILWTLYCLLFFELRLLVTPLVSSNFWPLYCLSFSELRLLVTPLVSCGHCVVCHSSDYGFWLPLWYIVDIVLSVIVRITLLVTPLVSCGQCIVCYSSNYGFWLPLWYLVDIVLSVILRITGSDYPFDILWTLYCLLFFELRVLITPLISCGHCIVCYFSNYGFWLPLWYLQTFLIWTYYVIFVCFSM